MARKASIEAQLKRAEEILPKIEVEYKNSLHKKSVSEDLKLDIQTFCGHLRSSLDYLAQEVVEKYCTGKKSRLYFPISDSDASFTKNLNDNYPGLEKSCAELHAFLRSIQPYKNSNNLWLRHFNQINNDNKHDDLVEQTRVETKTVNVTSPSGGSVSYGPGVTFGAGVIIMGVPVDPRTQLPVPNSIVKTEIITWVDFQFQTLNISALHLLKDALLNIKVIHEKINSYL